MLLTANEMREMGRTAVKPVAEKYVEDWMTKTIPHAMKGYVGTYIEFKGQPFLVEQCALELLRTLGYTVKTYSVEQRRYQVLWENQVKWIMKK